MNRQVALRIGLYVASALLIGAHFLRAGNMVMIALSLAAPLLFLVRAPWSPILLQIIAYCASANWIVTGMRIVQSREAEGRTWTAAAVIIGSVAAFTLLTGLLLNSRSIQERYRR